MTPSFLSLVSHTQTHTQSKTETDKETAQITTCITFYWNPTFKYKTKENCIHKFMQKEQNKKYTSSTGTQKQTTKHKIMNKSKK